MLSNVYTKDEILKELSSKGYFIDTYTLGTFFEQWHVEAIYEDEQGKEFYDKNTLDLILSNLFDTPKEDEHQTMPVLDDENETLNEENKEELKQDSQEPEQASQQEPDSVDNEEVVQEQTENIELKNENQTSDSKEEETMEPIQAKEEPEAQIEENHQTTEEQTQQEETVQVENQENSFEPQAQEPEDSYQEVSQQEPQQDSQEPEQVSQQEPDSVNNEEVVQEQTENIELKNEQEYQYQPQEQEIAEVQTQENFFPQEQEDIDDMSLISDSFEAQEKFREYILSQMAKTNPELVPRNEFKLDISERTLNMVARALAKKVAKYVSSMFGAEAKSMAKFDEIKEKNQYLEQKVQALEEQNKKLRMLLTESNRNLNSYKPGLFGLYKKVPPKK